ncbi:MAG: hypothetical protein AB7V32_08695, partial [Candidatus Berkiella sp.]
MFTYTISMFYEIESYVKVVSRFAGLGAKFIGVLLTIYGIKEIWFRKESKQLSTLFKLNLTLLYLAHMAAVSLAIAVLFGYTLVSSAVAAAIVSGTALVKAIVDLIKERLQLYILHKQYKEQKQHFSIYLSIFNNRLEIFNKNNQSLLSKTFDFISNKFMGLVSRVKKINFSLSSSNATLSNLNDIAVEIDECRNDVEGLDALANDLSSIIQTSKKMIDLQNEIQLINQEINSKNYIVQFTGITASLTLLLCFPINWIALPFVNPLVLLIGIVSAMTSIWGIYQKYLVEDELLAVQNKQVHGLIKSTVQNVEKINKVQARDELKRKLDLMVDSFDKNKSTESKVIPVILTKSVLKQSQHS